MGPRRAELWGRNRCREWLLRLPLSDCLKFSATIGKDLTIQVLTACSAPSTSPPPGTLSNSIRESPEGLLNPGSQTANRVLGGAALDESVAAALDFE